MWLFKNCSLSELHHKKMKPYKGSSTSSTDSSISTQGMLNLIDNLRRKGKRNSTQQNYYGIWKSFNEFFIKLDIKPDTWEERLTLYMGYLIENNKKSSTVRSYISAIKTVLQDDNIILNENKYLLISLTKACRYINDQVRTHLPICIGMLRIILNSVFFEESENNQPYLATMYQALFASAYYGLLRVGELTSGSHPIRAIDVHIAQNKNKVLLMSTGNNAKERKNPNQLCPFVILKRFAAMRPKCKALNEPFFVFADNSPVKPWHMREKLRKILEKEGFQSNLYGVHGFRSGMASDLLRKNVSIQRIKFLGRWRSNAIYTYLS